MRGLEIPFQDPGPAGMLELAERHRLDLPDAFAGQPEEFADLFQGVRVPGPDAVAEFQDVAFPRQSRSRLRPI